MTTISFLAVNHLFSIPNDPDPNRRYKAQRHADSTHLQTEKFAVSPDLFNWEWLDIPGVPQGGTSSFTYDEENRLFIITVKRRGPYGRSVYLTTSADFESWTEPELIFHADHQDQENGFERIAGFFDDPAYVSPLANRPEEYKTDVYFLPVFPYEGRYIGMPVFFHQSGMRAPKYENADGRKSIELILQQGPAELGACSGQETFHRVVAPWGWQRLRHRRAGTSEPPDRPQ